MRSLVFKNFKAWFLMIRSLWVALLFCSLLWLALGADVTLQAQVPQCQEGAASIPAAPLTLTVKEGANVTYQLRLCQPPMEPVTVTVAATPIGTITIQRTELQFNQSNFSTTQSINIKAIDDESVQGNRIITLVHTVVTTDSFYSDKIVDSVFVTVLDNEGNCNGTTALILAVESQFEIQEGERKPYTVRLCKEPTAPVTITIEADTANAVTLDRGVLFFDSGNYDKPQTVKVKAINDNIVQGVRHISLSHKATTADLSYQDESEVVIVTIRDNDKNCSETIPIISFDPPAVQVPEGTTQTYQINWCKQLTQPVSITLKTSLPPSVTVAPLSFSFSPGNQPVTRVVTITALNDTRYADNRVFTLTHSITTTDPAFTPLTKSPVVTVTVLEYEKGTFLPLVSYTPTVIIKPKTWTQVSNSGKSVDVVVVNQNALFAGQRRSGTLAGGIYKGTAVCQADRLVSADISVRDLGFNGPNGVVATFSNRTYSSVNNGDSWTATNTTSMNPFVYAVEYGSAPNTVYAGTDNGLYRSTNNGVDWQHVDPSGNSGPKFIYSLYFDKATPNKLWIGSYQEGVWQVNLDTRVFTKVNDGLPANDVKVLEIWEIVLDGADLYIATSNGVYKRPGSGVWQAYGLPNTAVFSLELVTDQSNKTLFAGLNAGGVHHTPLVNAFDWKSISSPALATKTVRDLFNDTTSLCAGLLAATDDGVWLYK